MPVVHPAAKPDSSAAQLNIDSQGNLLVNVAEGSFAVSTGAQYNATPPIFTDGTSNPLQSDSHGTLLVSQRDASGAVQGNLANPVRIDPVGTTTQPVSISGTVPVSISGTAAVALTPATSGGLSSSKLVSAASTNATSIKTSAGQLYNVQAFNTNASARFLKIYNKASAPTVGTDTPVATYLIPGNASGSGCVIEISNGLALNAGLAIAITGGIADNDTTAIGANDCVVNLQYK